jgi:hypothetical protein
MHFSRAVWWSVVKSAGFDEIDADSSGTVTREELSTALDAYYGHDMGELAGVTLRTMCVPVHF